MFTQTTKSGVYMCRFITKDQNPFYSYYTKFTSICHLVWKCSSRSARSITALWTPKSTITSFRNGKAFSNKTRRLTNLQIFNYRGIVVYGLPVHSFSHPLSIKSKLLHCLLLCKIRSFVEQLPRRLVLEPRHMEKSGRGADFCGHGCLLSERRQKVKRYVTTQ